MIMAWAFRRGDTATEPGEHWLGAGNIISPSSSSDWNWPTTLSRASVAMLHLVAPLIVPVCIELDLSSTTMTRGGTQSCAWAGAAWMAVAPMVRRERNAGRRDMTEAQ